MAERISATYYEVAGPYLLSDALYKTKIKSEDVPPWYMEGVYYGYKRGYLRAKGVSQLTYQPNLYHNHMFKDDFLYIQYADKPNLQAPSDLYPVPCREYVWGWNIPHFLVMAEKYSGYDISGIEQQIKEKQEWFRSKYQEDYKCEVGDRDILAWMQELRDKL